jgi:hypothetical protein
MHLLHEPAIGDEDYAVLEPGESPYLVSSGPKSASVLLSLQSLLKLPEGILLWATFMRADSRTKPDPGAGRLQ